MKLNTRFRSLIGAVVAAAAFAISLTAPAEALASNCYVSSNADSGAGSLRSCVEKIGSTNFESGIYITFAPAVTAIELDSPLSSVFVDDEIEGMVIDIAGPVSISPSASFTTGAADRLLELKGTGSPLVTLTEIDFSDANHGALYISGTSGATVNVWNSTFDGNATGISSLHGQGGAIKVSAPGADLFFYRNTFSNNYSYANGGALYVDAVSGTTYIHGDTFTYNTARGNGGAISTTGKLTIGSEAGLWDDVATFSFNEAQNGGALHVTGGITRSNWASFSFNEAFASGGALYTTTGGAVLFESQFKNNYAADNGGAISSDAGAIGTGGSHFESNAAGLLGGAVYSYSYPCEDNLFDASSFYSNSSGSSGGAIYSDCNLNIGHSTFYGNSATNAGGAVSAFRGADIAFATLIDNTAASEKDVKIWSGSGRTIGSVYASSNALDTTSRFSSLMTNTYPGNVSTGREGIFTNVGNVQGADFSLFDLSTSTQFTLERCDPYNPADCIESNTTKGFIPSATSTLLGGVTEAALDIFKLNAWEYTFETDQPGWTIEYPYAAGAVHETYTPGGPEFGGGQDDESEDVSDDVSGDISGDVPGTPPGGDPEDSPTHPVNPDFAITGVSHPSILARGDTFIAFGVGLVGTESLYLGETQVDFVIQADGSLRVTSPQLATGQYLLRAIGVDGVAVLHHAIWVVDNLNFKAWTKRYGDSVKIYAKNVIGIGKVQFFVDGVEIAWVTALDSSDPKLLRTNGFYYLVRTVQLKPDGSKTRIEVRLNGDRVRRNTYTIFGN